MYVFVYKAHWISLMSLFLLNPEKIYLHKSHWISLLLLFLLNWKKTNKFICIKVIEYHFYLCPDDDVNKHWCIILKTHYSSLLLKNYLPSSVISTAEWEQKAKNKNLFFLQMPDLLQLPWKKKFPVLIFNLSFKI